MCVFLIFAGCVRENRGENDMKASDSQRVVRRAVGSGRWFPGDGVELERMVESFIEGACEAKICGLITGGLAPHAGYLYSGKVAGHTYRAIRDQALAGNSPDAVVVLGFSHRQSFNGVALMDGDALATPLGEAMLDKDAAAFMCGYSDLIRMDYGPHHGEWSAENQVPFLQVALSGVPLVIAIIGDHDAKTADALVGALEALAARKKIIVVGSTDLLHDADYELVTKTDKETLKLIEAMDIGGLTSGWNFRRQTCCGIMAVLTTMRFVESRGCKKGTVLFYRNSGDDFPESRGEWVVGYGAVVFAK